MAPQTRSTTKRLAQVDNRYHIYSSNPSTPLPPYITRSVTRNFKLIGIIIPTTKFPARIIKRRHTSTTIAIKPARRLRRIQTLSNFFKPNYKTYDFSVRMHIIKTNCNCLFYFYSIDPAGAPIPRSWCICRRISFGTMIFCDNPSCLIKWFHLECISMHKVPENDWYCANCALLQ